MSSMAKRVVIGSLLAASVAAAATYGVRQTTDTGDVSAPPAMAVTRAGDPLDMAVAEWSRLRQGGGYAFADYARFLLAHSGWPDEPALRKAAERQVSPDALPAPAVAAFFDRFAPVSGAAQTRYAEALAALGRTTDAQAAARRAWTGAVGLPDDEARLLSRFAGGFTPQDHDSRMEMLLAERAPAAAGRQIAFVSPARGGVYGARLAMLARGAGAGALGQGYDRDPGFVLDRAMWLRDTGQIAAARAYLAGPITLDGAPYLPARWLTTLLSLAKSADADGQAGLAYAIAQKADLAYAPGTAIRDRPLAERDPYTSLVWLGGDNALVRLRRPADAAAMFEHYARAAQTPGTQTRGLYWAARAYAEAGRPAQSQALYAEAAVHADAFYGQLSAERLGRALALPPDPAPVDPGPLLRSAFEASELVRVARLLGREGRWEDQTLFVKQIAADAVSQADHVLAVGLSRALGRPDLGVMVARNARVGTSDPVRYGFPEIAVPPAYEGRWTMIHAISRQESQFDREATSRVGAKGLMQLMPGTAREEAGKLGLPYDYARLSADPQYNVMLGSSFYARLLESFGGSHVLAVAAYNAGPGNVRKFIRANGDPRLPGTDVLQWIEAIPLQETRAYVQHVLENAVMYDLLNPERARMPTTNRLSAYLGKTSGG